MTDALRAELSDAECDKAIRKTWTSAGYQGGTHLSQITQWERAIYRAGAARAAGVREPDMLSLIREAIEQHISPAEIKGAVTCHDGEWRALVALAPAGPLVLMGFRLSVGRLPTPEDDGPPLSLRRFGEALDREDAAREQPPQREAPMSDANAAAYHGDIDGDFDY